MWENMYCYHKLDANLTSAGAHPISYPLSGYVTGANRTRVGKSVNRLKKCQTEVTVGPCACEF